MVSAISCCFAHVDFNNLSEYSGLDMPLPDVHAEATCVLASYIEIRPGDEAICLLDII